MNSQLQLQVDSGDSNKEKTTGPAERKKVEFILFLQVEFKKNTIFMCSCGDDN